MKKLSFFLILLATALGCMTQRRAVSQLGKIQKKHPDLFTRDTVTIDSFIADTIALHDTTIIDNEYIDTAVVTSLTEIIEDLTVENARLKIQLRTTTSIETNTRTWELTGTSKPDTIIKIKEVPIRAVIFKTVPGQPCQVVQGAPWWYYILFALGGALFTYLGLKKDGLAEVVKGFLKV